MAHTAKEPKLSANVDEMKEESFQYAMHLALSSVLPMTLQAANELGIFDIIAESGSSKLSASQIAAKLPTENPDAPQMLERILVLLTTHSLLDCSLESTDRFYSLTPASKYYVRNQDGVSLGPLAALIQDPVFLQSWSKLKDAVLEGGIPFNMVHGTHAFEYSGLDPRFNQVFNSAMFNVTNMMIKQTWECYDGFENLKQLVDVGGGLGHSLKAITFKYPHIKGINFDLPHVVQHASTYPGVEHVGGDMFEFVPRGEAIFMKSVLHDWSDEHCLKLLKNCCEAIPDDGKVIVVEYVLPAVINSAVSAKLTSQTDMIMMTQNPGGKERTKDEFLALANQSGFRGIRFVCPVCNLWIMEFFK